MVVKHRSVKIEIITDSIADDKCENDVVCKMFIHHVRKESPGSGIKL